MAYYLLLPDVFAVAADIWWVAFAVIMIWGSWVWRFEIWRSIRRASDTVVGQALLQPSPGYFLIACWCHLFVATALAFVVPTLMGLLEADGMLALAPGTISTVAYWYGYLFPLSVAQFVFVLLSVALDHIIPYANRLNNWISEF